MSDKSPRKMAPLLLIIVEVVTASCTVPPTPVSNVKAESWQLDGQLGGLPTGFSIRWPSLAIHGDALVMAANLFPVDGTSPMKDPLVILDTEGRVYPNPGSGFSYLYPRIVSILPELHILFGASKAPALHPREWPGISVLSLVHSRWGDDGWSTPVEILSAARLAWDGKSLGIAIEGSRLHLVLPGQDSNYTPVLFYLRYDGSAWLSRQLPLPASAAKVGMLGGDTIAVVYAGPGHLSDPNMTGLQVLISPDAGQTWGSPRTIVATGQGSASIIELLRDETTGRLHLLWYERNGLGPVTLRYDVSTDQGRSWHSGAPPLELHGHLIRSSAALDPCGKPRVVVEQLLKADSLVIREWAPAHDNLSHSVFPHLQSVGNVGLAPGHDSLYLIASALLDPLTPAVTILATTGCIGPEGGTRAGI